MNLHYDIRQYNSMVEEFQQDENITEKAVQIYEDYLVNHPIWDQEKEKKESDLKLTAQ